MELLLDLLVLWPLRSFHKLLTERVQEERWCEYKRWYLKWIIVDVKRWRKRLKFSWVTVPFRVRSWPKKYVFPTKTNTPTLLVLKPSSARYIFQFKNSCTSCNEILFMPVCSSKYLITPALETPVVEQVNGGHSFPSNLCVHQRLFPTSTEISTNIEGARQRPRICAKRLPRHAKWYRVSINFYVYAKLILVYRNDIVLWHWILPLSGEIDWTSDSHKQPHYSRVFLMRTRRISCRTPFAKKFIENVEIASVFELIANLRKMQYVTDTKCPHFTVCNTQIRWLSKFSLLAQKCLLYLLRPWCWYTGIFNNFLNEYKVHETASEIKFHCNNLFIKITTPRKSRGLKKINCWNSRDNCEFCFELRPRSMRHRTKYLFWLYDETKICIIRQKCKEFVARVLPFRFEPLWLFSRWITLAFN